MFKYIIYIIIYPSLPNAAQPCLILFVTSAVSFYVPSFIIVQSWILSSLFSLGVYINKSSLSFGVAFEKVVWARWFRSSEVVLLFFFRQWQPNQYVESLQYVFLFLHSDLQWSDRSGLCPIKSLKCHHRADQLHRHLQYSFKRMSEWFDICFGDV